MRISVYKDRYPTSFVVPRQSRHTISPRLFAPLGKISDKLNGLSLYPDLPGTALLHAHNRIPIGHPRYVLTFESHLPHNFAARHNGGIHRFMMREISSRRCRRLLGLSHFAKRNFLRQNAGAPELERLEGKLLVRHPNVVIPNIADPLAGDLAAGRLDKLVLTFGGGHFARKGGCVAVRFAEEANRRNWPVHVNIVSSLRVGEVVWTDPVNDEFFEPYRHLLNQPNVTFHEGLPNDELTVLFAHSHFTLLPTFSDTFGYTAIEGMAGHTPVIATDIQAIPEFVKDGVNGLLLHLDTDEAGYWKAPPYHERHLPSYETFFRDQVEFLVEQMLDRVEPYLDKPADLLRMRRASRFTAEQMFAPDVSASFYDDFYERVSKEDTRTEPKLDPVRDVSSPTVDDLDFSSLDMAAA